MRSSSAKYSKEYHEKVKRSIRESYGSIKEFKKIPRKTYDQEMKEKALKEQKVQRKSRLEWESIKGDLQDYIKKNPKDTKTRKDYENLLKIKKERMKHPRKVRT